MIPDNVEKIIMTKEDYDRQAEQMLLEKLEAEQRIEKAIEYIKDEYYRRDDNKFLGEVEIDGLLAILEGKDE